MMTSPAFRVLAIALVCLFSSAGCNRSSNADLDAARAEAQSAKAELAKMKADADAARAEATAAKGELIKARAEADAARGEAKAARAELAKLSKPALGSDRRAAEWVLRVGGNMTAVVEGVPTEFKKGGTLPEEGKSFKIIKVQLAANPLVRDEGLQYLKGLDLEELDLHHNGDRISDLRFLKGMTRLKLVGLAGTGVSDAGLEFLRDASRLEILHVTACEKITDKGMAHLTELKELKQVNVTGTKVTDAGVARLRAALPKCEIITHE